MSIGADFARAFAAKDFEGVRALLHPEVDFAGLTPRRHWAASSPDEVDGILRSWLEDKDEVEALDQVDDDVIADRERVGYRMRVRNPDGDFVVEQQAYLAAQDGQITWMRVICTGFRPQS